LSLRLVWRDALRAAKSGGIPGAAAMALQILLFCWLRTISHYQQVKGGTLLAAARVLWQQGVDSDMLFPVLRFYQGVLPALIQGPLCRAGDTAANEGVLVLLSPLRRRLPLYAITAVGTLAACCWRAALTPLDTVKLVLEVDGFSTGLALLRNRLRHHGLLSFYAGWLGVAVTAAVSHWPWFCVNNLLQARLAPAVGRRAQLLRSALIGFFATLCSDVAANPMRVLKTTVQTSDAPMSYAQAVASISAAEGALALLTRGLAAKICANALQGVVFSVLWKAFMERYQMSEAHAHGGRRSVLGSVSPAAADERTPSPRPARAVDIDDLEAAKER